MLTKRILIIKNSFPVNHCYNLNIGAMKAELLKKVFLFLKEDYVEEDTIETKKISVDSSETEISFVEDGFAYVRVGDSLLFTYDYCDNKINIEKDNDGWSDLVFETFHLVFG